MILGQSRSFLTGMIFLFLSSSNFAAATLNSDSFNREDTISDAMIFALIQSRQQQKSIFEIHKLMIILWRGENSNR